MPFSALVCYSLIYDPLNMKQGKWHYGPELYESAEAKAEALIQAELKRNGWAEGNCRCAARLIHSK